MDMDTAVFLDMCEQLADKNREMTEDQVVIALLIASTDVLGKVPPAQAARGFKELRSLAMRVIPVAEAEGFIVIQEEM
jgi:hypothetical protein